MMKKNICILAFCLINFLGYSQNAKISGTIRNAKDSIINIELAVSTPFDVKKYNIVTKTGEFEFKFDVDRLSKASLRLNGKFAFFPGWNSILIEPEDDIHISFPEMKTTSYFGFGITNLNFSGQGSEKINLVKSAVDPWLKLFALDRVVKEKSLTYLYNSADIKLNVIDSVFDNYKGNVSSYLQKIIKAQNYSIILENLFIASTQSKSDSVRFLFNKYIVDKNRIDVLFKDDVIYYQDYNGILPDYILLSEINNPAYLGDNFRKNNIVNVAKMGLKYTKNYPIVRDYLLTRSILNRIKSKYDDTSVKELYQLYIDNVNPKNPFYDQVKSAYEYIQQNLIAGKTFYQFSLPDPNGKIHRLKDFEGKVLIFDFWFNGCAGCKLMVPFMEELEKEYEGKSVQFISVSIDKRKWWLDGIGKYSSKNSLQLYTEDQGSKHPFIKHLNFSSYPRLIVVDKNGNMGGTPPDPRSDKAGFKKFVDKYL